MLLAAAAAAATPGASAARLALPWPELLLLLLLRMVVLLGVVGGRLAGMWRRSPGPRVHIPRQCCLLLLHLQGCQEGGGLAGVPAMDLQPASSAPRLT